MKDGAFRPVHILAGVRANLFGNVARTAASTRGLACPVRASQGTVTTSPGVRKPDRPWSLR